jgi:phosphoribosylamine--glycine ligase
VVTDGGRVLSVTAYGNDIDQAADKAYRAISRIDFAGMQYRRDIGWRSRRARR